MREPIVIDTMMHGRPGVTGCFVVRGKEQTALIETGPQSCMAQVLAGLEDAGVETLDWIIVTHIHLDHAGAAGTLAQRFPSARIGVHPVGASHLVDPSKLWSSAGRIYGERMNELWGGIDALSEDRIAVLSDGDTVDLGGRTLVAIETPGHASHHHAFLDSQTGALFAGDALGVRLHDVGLVRPATPPPEFDLEQAIASIHKIAEARPARLFFTHFGADDSAGVAETCDEAIAALRTWEGWVRKAREETDELDAAASLVRDQARGTLEGGLSESQIDRMDQTTSYWMNTWGYLRYLRKRDQGQAG
ncbi:MAG TPA: MBL fold metallo-hydrolase [Actinomycetota bacterium]|nr:MBL fold metallo-hydrolase [Actinomycetota bacterium]